MEVYRVYESYHEPDESGTNEYGTYSSLENAKERLAAIWAKKNYPDPKPKDKTDNGWWAQGAWDSCSMVIERIEVDKDRDDSNTGYT